MISPSRERRPTVTISRMAKSRMPVARTTGPFTVMIRPEFMGASSQDGEDPLGEGILHFRDDFPPVGGGAP